MSCTWTLLAVEGPTVLLTIRGHMDGDEAVRAIQTFQELARSQGAIRLIARLDAVTGYESTVPGWWAEAILECREHLQEVVLVGVRSLILRTTARVAAESVGIALRCEEVETAHHLRVI